MLAVERQQGTIPMPHLMRRCRQVSDTATAIASQTSSAVSAPSVTAYRSARAVVSDRIITCDNNLVADGLSKLRALMVYRTKMHYVIANQRSIQYLQRNMLQQLTDLPSRGRVKIKDIGGPAAETDVALLYVSLTTTYDK
jgi:hypothetical protein